MKLLRAILFPVACLSLFSGALDGQIVSTDQPQIRTPVALALCGDTLVVANGRSGSVSVIDAKSFRLIGETSAAQGISDLVATPDGRSLLVTDPARGELVCLAREGKALRVAARVAISSEPVTVRVAPDGSTCAVASRWSRRLTLIGLDGPPHIRRVVDLPFAPREQVFMPGGRSVIIADAFGGQLAVVDAQSGTITSLRSLQAHNLRGLAVSPGGESILIAHQILDPNTPTESSRIGWGQVVGNVFRDVPLTELMSANAATRTSAVTAEVVRHWSLYPLGESGRGAGDPGATAVSRDGVTAVALGGVNEVAIRSSSLDGFRRVAVGRRPVALAFSADGKRLFVANAFDDSVSVVDVGASRGVATISLGRRPALTEEQRGEQLFYDARLSLDGWYSCASCHPDGHTNGLRNDNSTDGSFGTPKLIPSLLGVEESRPWGWSGQMQTHEAQVQQSVLGTMHGPPAGASADHVNALAAFLRTLPPAPGLAAARDEAKAPAVARGQRVFIELRCRHCHSLPDLTSEGTYDVGVQDEAGMTRFNPPSLRGVSQRDAFLHDGRGRSLDEVFLKFGHPDGRGAQGKSVEDLVAYLRSL